MYSSLNLGKWRNELKQWQVACNDGRIVISQVQYYSDEVTSLEIRELEEVIEVDEHTLSDAAIGNWIMHLATPGKGLTPQALHELVTIFWQLRSELKLN